jgi:hypothetical protein
MAPFPRRSAGRFGREPKARKGRRHGGYGFSDIFGAYGFSLAVDLKRVVGDRFHVEYRKKEIVVPNPLKVEEAGEHTWQGSEPKDTRWMEYFPIPRSQEG